MGKKYRFPEYFTWALLSFVMISTITPIHAYDYAHDSLVVRQILNETNNSDLEVESCTGWDMTVSNEQYSI
ncbi:MAG: hypothetical protein JNL74_09610 [Fibrobacteres bacterium]|nr:hypothetical protein [Fibrobacterota bacterium]